MDERSTNTRYNTFFTIGKWHKMGLWTTFDKREIGDWNGFKIKANTIIVFPWLFTGGYLGVQATYQKIIAVVY